MCQYGPLEKIKQQANLQWCAMVHILLLFYGKSYRKLDTILQVLLAENVINMTVRFSKDILVYCSDTCNQHLS